MPFENESSARLLDPKIDHIRIRRTKGSGDGTVQGVKVPNTISIIWYIVKSDDKEVPRAQSLRFPTKSWTESEARAWIKKHKIKVTLFEPAKKETNFYDYENKSESEISISLHRDIGFDEDTTSEAFYNLLTPDLKKINIDINSRGGTIMDGISIYSQLKDHPAEVNVKISGVAASMASVIAMAGDTIEMPETSMMMIHKPLLPFLVGVNADKLRKHAEALDVMEESIILAYKTRMDKTKSEISEMLRAETWLNADKAKELGLADVITEEDVDVLTYHDFSDFKNVPELALNFSLEANHEIDIPKEEITFVSKVKKYFNIPEEEDMPTEKVDVTNELTTAQAKISTLEAENKALKEKTEAEAREKAEISHKAFLSRMIKEGRVRPVDEEFHLENMMNRDEDGLEKYRNWLKEFPKVVDNSGEHVATKEKANPKTEMNLDDELAKEAEKIVTEKKCTYMEALDILRVQKPELCN